MSVSITSKNGHFKHIAVAIVSGETVGNTAAVLDAVAAAVKAKFPDEDGQSELFMSDDGPSIAPAVIAHLNAIGSKQPRGSCSVHLEKDIIPKQKSLFQSCRSPA